MFSWKENGVIRLTIIAYNKMATKEITIKFLGVDITRTKDKYDPRYYWRLIGLSGEDRVEIESPQTFDTRAKAFTDCEQKWAYAFTEQEWIYEAKKLSIIR